MKGRFKPVVLPRYPRMSPEDAITWSKFLAQHGDEYLSFDYDLRVGSGVVADEKVPEKYNEDFRLLTMKRIDAVGFKEKGADIFEVKQRAGLSALGQLNAYQRLFQQSYPSIPVLSLNLVCDFATAEEIELYKQSGINVFVYAR